MPDLTTLGAEGTEENGAQGTGTTDGSTTPPAVGATESIEEQARKLDFVKEALQAKAELAEMRKAQDEQKAAAERAKLEAEGNYKAALEQIEAEKLSMQQSHANEIKNLSLTAELMGNGFKDKRAVSLFASQWDPGKQTVEEYVKSVKEDALNSMYFGDPEQRTPGTPPAPTGGGSGDDFTPEMATKWLISKDPKQRAAANSYLDKKFEAEWLKNH